MKGPAETQVISKSYLSGLIIQCGLFFTIGLILTGIILYFSAHQPLGPTYQDSFSRLSQLKEEMLHKSIAIYATLMVIVMAGVIFTTVIYSHRVVGPMIGLKRILGLLLSGDLTTPAVLRTKDAIKPMANAINDMIGTYKTRVSSIASNANEIRDLSNQAYSKEQLDSIAEKAANISHIIKTIKLQ